jgi:hypothetical protein
MSEQDERRASWVLSSTSNVLVPFVEFKNTPLLDALDQLRTELQTQTQGKPLLRIHMALEGLSDEKVAEAKKRTITFGPAKGASLLDLIKIISWLGDCRFKMRDAETLDIIPHFADDAKLKDVEGLNN